MAKGSSFHHFTCPKCVHFRPSSSSHKHYKHSKGTVFTVQLLFLHHKKEYENPGKDFLQQKIEKAFTTIKSSPLS